MSAGRSTMLAGHPLHAAAFDAEDVTRARMGATFTRDTLAIYAGPADGAAAYAVGGVIPGRTIPAASPPGILADTILAMRADMIERAPGGYIGTWIDGATIYVDAVVILPDLASAGILARTLGERAVYAFREGETILAEDARPKTCKACGEPMDVTVRGHHHSEDGKDVT